MKLTLEAEDEKEETLLGQEKLELENVEQLLIIAKALKGGVVPFEYSRSIGNDIEWLVGKTYSVLKLLEHTWFRVRESGHAGTS